MSSTAQSSSVGTGNKATASAQAASKPQGTTVVAGESAESVQVQSQLASSTVDGKGATRSNLTQVVSKARGTKQGSAWRRNSSAAGC